MRLNHVCYQCKNEWEAEGVPTDKELCSTCSPEFKTFNKIARLSRDIVITEKIDGTNGLVYIDENNNIFAGSRNRWLDEHTDNHGFYHWVMDEKEELLKLSKGYHYGEFWGNGIQRGYDLPKGEKRFSLFNVSRWCMWNEEPKLISIDPKTKVVKYQEKLPQCCYLVPILYIGLFDTIVIDGALTTLKFYGSKASPGFLKPEGIVIYHKQGNVYFKKTIENDEKGKNEEK
jgi:hypothetical protein